MPSSRKKHLYRWRALLTSGGYLAPLEPHSRIAARLAQNMRGLISLRSSAALEKAFNNAEDTNATPRPLRNLHQIALLHLHSDRKNASDRFAYAIAKTVAADAAQSRPAIADAVRALACGRLFIDGFRVQPSHGKRGHTYDELICQNDPAMEKTLDDALIASLGRAANALRQYAAQYTEQHATIEPSGSNRLQRLVESQPDALDDEDARHASWSARPPSAPGPGEHVRDAIWPIVQGTLLTLLTLWFWWAMRRPMPPMERRLSQPPEAPRQPHRIAQYG